MRSINDGRLQGVVASSGWRPSIVNPFPSCKAVSLGLYAALLADELTEWLKLEVALAVGGFVVGQHTAAPPPPPKEEALGR
jgi:hypothetical protein